MSKKKFLLVAPTTFNLYRLIVHNLEYLGYEVTHIENDGYIFRYRSWGQRIYNFIRKVLFSDKTYKMKLRECYINETQQQIIDQHDSFDVALVIRADFFEKDLMKSIRQKASQMISFHFDGVSRNPEVLEYVRFFDRFYVFDEEDIVKYPSYGLLYSPNFYFDYPGLLSESVTDNPYNVYYVSTFHESRMQELIRVHQYLSDYYVHVQFVVVCNMGKEHLMPDYIHENMAVHLEHVPFDTQLQYIAYADVIIDLVVADHNGYSFRIIEGLKFEKKVITTNTKVLEADFYHPNNFFILRSDNYDQLDAFLKVPYVPIDSAIKHKYSFSEWLNSKIIQ